MKTFKRLMSFALALLMLASVIPTSVISARAAPTNAEMMDNYVLDAMKYLGYRMEDFKESGNMYVSASASVPYAPDLRYDEDDWGDKKEGTLRGLETTTDANGKTIPDKDKFSEYGLVCASYTSYYYLNYLPNVKGVNVSAFKEDMQYWKGKTGLSWQGAYLWRYALEKIAADTDGSITRIYHADYDEKDKNGNPKKPEAADYEKMKVGDIITFGYADANGNEKFSHVGIYLGGKNGEHWMSHCVPRTYTDSKGNTHHVSIVFGTIDSMYFSGGPKPASIVTGVYRIKDVPHVPEQTGKIEVYKKDPNGKNLAGAMFKATNTADSSMVYYIGPTDNNGYAISEDEIPYGTYKIAETVFPDGYTTSGTSEWTVMLNANTSNATITINAVNKLITGTGRIVKTSTNGGTVQGWWFYVWKVTDDGWVWNCRKQTDSNGVITMDLVPGRYVVREVKLSLYKDEGLTVPSGVDPQYWVQDTSDKYLDITANGTATVTFNNSYYGKIKVQKSTNTGGDLAGWKFTILNSSGSLVATVTTDSNGVATSGNLAPGTYYVKEVDAPSNTDGWFMDITTSGGVVCANNLLVNSNFANSTKNWSGSNSTGVSVTTVDGKKVLKADPSVGTQDVGYVTQSVCRTGAGKYTLSADIYVEQDRKIYLAMWDASSGSWSGLGTTTKNLKAGWNHVEHTFTLNKDYNLVIAGIGGVKSSGAFYLYHPKFVCGDTATPWAADRTVTVTAGSTATHNVKNVKGGKIAVQKNTNTGEYLSGWQFEVKDSSGKLITTLVTDVTGYAVSDILAPGTYSVTEIGNSNPDFNPDYWDMDNTPTRTVTISADTYKEIHTETYDNTHVGKGKIQKVTVNGGTVEGWRFQIWSVNPDSTRTWVGNYGTNAEGVIELSLLPGQYVIREQNLDTYGDYPLPEGVDPEYWECDYTDKYITIVAGETTEVAFVNRQIGKVEIVKTLTDPSLGTVEGWRFSIANEAGQGLGIYTTDATGTIVTDLEPGTYIVTELMDADSMWECITPNPQTVTVEAGKTATVSFVNAPRTGEIRIYKVDTNNQPLDGVEFLLEWSENGTDWQPVYSCEPGNPQIGGCTSESLKEGRLVSGADGIVVFDGLHPALQYRLTETATKNGYQLLAGYAYQGKLPMDRDLTVSIRVVNAEKFTLPNTGSQSLVLMPMSVLLCLGLCAGAILFLRRKED